MSVTLEELLVSVGYTIDEASRNRMISQLERNFAEVSAKEDKAGQERKTIREALSSALLGVEQKAGDQQVAKIAERTKRERDAIAKSNEVIADDAKKAAEKREKGLDDDAKRHKDRREREVRDLRAFATDVRTVMGTVATAVGLAGAVSIGGFLASVKGSAADFSRLQVQSRRVGSTPQNIRAVEYALGQMGVDKGEASASLNNFADLYKSNPEGYAALLSSMGIRSKDAAGKDKDLGLVLGDMGKWFGSQSDPVARMQASRFGISTDAMIGLRQYAEVMRHVAEYNEKAAKFGLNVNKAAEDGRKFTAAYDNIATDLGLVFTKIQSDFFGPLTKAMNGVAGWLEAHPDQAKAYTEGFLALSAALSVSLIPKLLRLTGILGALGAIAPPAWLLRYLGVAGAVGAVMNPTALNAGEPQIGSDGVITYPDGRREKARQWDGKSKPQAGDQRNWWQRTMPKWAGGKDAPAAGAAPAASGGDRSHVSTTGPVGRTGGNPNLNAENANAIVAAARELGTTPEDLATVIGYETAGSYSTSKWGGTGGKYMGLIQFGPNERKQFGVSPDQTFPQQMESVKAYLKARGFKPGMGIADLYSTINAGSPGLYNRSDGNGTVMDHVARMQKERAATARAFVAMARRPLGEDDRETRARSTTPVPSAEADYARTHNPNRPQTPSMPGAVPMLPAGRFSLRDPIGVTPGMQTSIDNSRRESSRSFTQNVTVNGVQRPDEVADAVKVTARRGGQDYLRFTQGSIS